MILLLFTVLMFLYVGFISCLTDEHSANNYSGVIKILSLKALLVSIVVFYFCIGVVNLSFVICFIFSLNTIFLFFISTLI